MTVHRVLSRAGKILAERFEKVRTIEFKCGIGLVTAADKPAKRI